MGQRSPPGGTRAGRLRAPCRTGPTRAGPTDGLTQAARRRKVAPDRGRALSRAEVEALLTREDIAPGATLWRLLYETAARSAEVLRLDVEDLDLPNRRARVRRKGGRWT